MPETNPTPPPTEAELATLTSSERELWEHLSAKPATSLSDFTLRRLLAEAMRLRLAARREEWMSWSELPEEWKDGRRFLALHARRTSLPHWLPYSILYFDQDGGLDYDGDSIGRPEPSHFTHVRAMPAPPRAEKAVGDA